MLTVSGHGGKEEAAVPIITISRGSYSGGKMLAECVAARLGYRCIDRDHIICKAAEWGVSQDDLRAAIEEPPSFLGQSQHTKYIYVAFIQAALTEEVRSGNAVYHGLAGHLLLGRGPHVLRTRLIAPMEFRISKVQERLHYDRAQAIAHIEKMDKGRRKWTQFLYGVDWESPSLYDLVLSLEQMDLKDACEVIATAAQRECFQATRETQRALNDLARASWLKANLAMNAATSDLQFEIMVQGEKVTIKGEVVNPAHARKIASIAREVLGPCDVQLDQLALANRF